MGIFQKLSGFNNPITGARRTCGCCIMVVGLIMLIPSIIGLIWSNNIYYNSEVTYTKNLDPYTITNPSVGDDHTFTATDVFTQSNNYDIKLFATAVGPAVVNGDGQFTVTVSITGFLTVSDQTLTDSGFNSTSKGSDSDKLEFEEDLTQNYASVDFLFEITSLNNVSSISFQLEIFENPKRQLVNTMNNISLLIAIPGAIVCCCGVIVAPPGKKE